jgi:hypothetical protein
MTDEEIVMVLRCAADLANAYQYTIGCMQDAFVWLGYRLDERIAIYAINDRVESVGMTNALSIGQQSWSAKRDALLEAAARIEEGYAIRR